MNDWAVRTLLGLFVFAIATALYMRIGGDFRNAQRNATVMVLTVVAVLGIAITLIYS